MSPLTLRAASSLFHARWSRRGLGLFCGVALTAGACAHGPSSPPQSPTPSPLASAAASASEPRVDRIVVEADAIALIAPGETNSNGAMPNVFVLGRADRSTRLFLRFTVRLPKLGSLRGASLLLSRTSDVDMAPAPVELHALRVVEPWNPRTITWPFQPRLEDVPAPPTPVRLAGPEVVRIDVRPIVQDWAFHDPKDQGIAVVSDVVNATGASFAYISENRRPPELELLWAYPNDVDAAAPDAGGPADAGSRPEMIHMKR